MDFPVLTLVVFSIVSTSIALVYLIRVRPRIRGEDQAEMLRAFSTAVEARTGNEGETEAIRTYAIKIGEQLQLPPSNMRHLSHAVHLCDIGMSAIPFQFIKDSAVSNYSEEVAVEIERHAEISAAMVGLVPSFAGLADIVRCHHAPFSGKEGSYLPVRTEIPIEARILCVASAFVSTTQTQGALIAKETLLEGVGIVYCPEVVEALMGILKTEWSEMQSERFIAV